MLSRASVGASIGLVCACLLLAVPARADWQYAQFGMKPDEVVKASNGKAQLVTDRSRNMKGCAGKVSADYETQGELIFFVTFCFAKANDRLERVRLDLKDPTQDKVAQVIRSLRQQYRLPEADTEEGDTAVIRWSDRKRGYLVTVYRFGSTLPESQVAVSVQYEPLPATD
jgi:hypothetical protein